MTKFNTRTKQVQNLLYMQDKIVKILEMLEPLADQAETLDDYNSLEMCIRSRIQDAADDLVVARVYLNRRVDDIVNCKNLPKE